MTRRGKEFYLRLLAYALVEIRASDRDGPSPHARAIADSFHNLPAELAGPWTAADEREAFEYVRAQANRHGILHLIDAWASVAAERARTVA